MYASMTSAAVAEVSGQDALVPPAAQIGGGLVPWSMSAQPKKCAVSLLHSDQPRSGLGGVGRLNPGVGGGAPGGQPGELILEDDDRTVRRVRREPLDLRLGEHRLRALEDPPR